MLENSLAPCGLSGARYRASNSASLASLRSRASRSEARRAGGTGRFSPSAAFIGPRSAETSSMVCNVQRTAVKAVEAAAVEA